MVKPPPPENWDEKGEVETAPKEERSCVSGDRTLQMPLQKKLVMVLIFMPFGVFVKDNFRIPFGNIWAGMKQTKVVKVLTLPNANGHGWSQGSAEIKTADKKAVSIE